jgi:hypothetical protein
MTSPVSMFHERERIVGSLVWLKGPRGPYAEKRAHDMPSNDPPQAVVALVLAEHPLTVAEYELKIAILEQRYPAPPTDKED